MQFRQTEHDVVVERVDGAFQITDDVQMSPPYGSEIVCVSALAAQVGLFWLVQVTIGQSSLLIKFESQAACHDVQ